MLHHRSQPWKTPVPFKSVLHKRQEQIRDERYPDLDLDRGRGCSSRAGLPAPCIPFRMSWFQHTKRSWSCASCRPCERRTSPLSKFACFGMKLSSPKIDSLLFAVASPSVLRLGTQPIRRCVHASNASCNVLRQIPCWCWGLRPCRGTCRVREDRLSGKKCTFVHSVLFGYIFTGHE